MYQILFTIFFVSSSLFALDDVKKKTICLNMIVKNEKEVITRCLESALPIIDTWVIVDTGSTDGTQEVIREYLKGIPGQLYERPWINFGHNRQEALLLAKEKGDYLLFMDADDILVFSDTFKLPDLTSDFYAIPSSVGGNEYWTPRLVKSNLEWFWEGIIHEDLLCRDTLTGLSLDGIRYVYLHDGARAKDSNSVNKDIAILQEAMKTDPANSRTVFYLARSYLSAHLPEPALEYFEKRAQMGGNPEEIFYSNLMIGRLQSTLQFDFKIVEGSLLKTYLSRPHRAEPLYYLACKLCERGEYEKGYQILKAALELPSNITDCMFLEKWIYDYGLLFQLIVCAEQTGRYQKGLASCEKLMQRSDLPKDVKEKIEVLFESLHKRNIEHVKKRLLTIL